jgi:hypothetical protein
LRSAALLQKVPHHHRVAEAGPAGLGDPREPLRRQAEQIAHLCQIHFCQVVLVGHEELVCLVERKEVRGRVGVLGEYATERTERCVAIYKKKNITILLKNEFFFLKIVIT